MLLKPEITFIQSPNYVVLPTRQIRLIVLHSAECAESPQAAENLASWAKNKMVPSWHYAVDVDSITQSVDDRHVARHAKEVNAYSLGIEQAGRASQTADQWADPYSKQMLERTAHLIAYKCHEHTIPIELVSADKLAEQHAFGGAWGITTHAMVSKAFKTKGGHWDPGPNYPIQWVLDRADEISALCGVKK